LEIKLKTLEVISSQFRIILGTETSVLLELEVYHKMPNQSGLVGLQNKLRSVSGVRFNSVSEFMEPKVHYSSI